MMNKMIMNKNYNEVNQNIVLKVDKKTGIFPK